MNTWLWRLTGLEQEEKEKITNRDFSIKNSDSVSIEEIRFVFHQAERRLDDSVKAYDSMTGKSLTLVTLTTAVFSTLTSYFFLQNEIDGNFNSKLTTVFIITVYLFFILIGFLRNINPTNYYPAGSLPSKLLIEDFYMNRHSTDTQDSIAKEMYYSELLAYNVRIKHNLRVNDLRSGRFSRAVRFLIAAPAVSLLIYIAISFLSGQ